MVLRSNIDMADISWKTPPEARKYLYPKMHLRKHVLSMTIESPQMLDDTHFGAESRVKWPTISFAPSVPNQAQWLRRSEALWSPQTRFSARLARAGLDECGQAP